MADNKEFRFNLRNYPTITSPKVSLRWPKLLKPGKKYKKEDELEFITDFVMSEAEGQAWFDKVIRPLVDKAWAEFSEDERNKKKVKSGFAPSYDMKPELDAEDEETGNVIFKAKTNATRKDKDGVVKEVQIPMWDASGKRIPHGKVNPYGGTTAKVKFDAVPYAVDASKKVGISFRLREVQIINLVEGGERAPSGFDSVEDEDAYRQEDGGGFSETVSTDSDSVDDASEF